ncbi:MAG: polysaccharide biosynthesis tyrosine autokinase, partial [Duncaniella sp.]|nr:polysaccharide biosynthesis tyrosine autokinase [Duncaniella sp.]
LNMQISSLQGSQASTTSKIASNPSQAKYLLSVERQQKVKESLYLFLLQKREENELSQAFTAYNTKIVERPGGSSLPTFPNKRNVLMVSFLLGLAIPFGIIYFKESNNTKVRGRKDVEHLAVPFLGELPQHGHDKKNVADEANTIVVEGGKRDIINEAFRVLRTNVEFMCNSSEGNKVIAMTSFNPGSGKSFVSMNLGMAIALKGKKVLIVDGDMRHGSTSAYMGSPARGLADYLSGAVADVDPLIVKTPECQNLQVLPIGSIPPNPTELLESPRFGELIGELKARFDYVIIDCPPIEVVADAQIIDKFADRTFFVIRAGLFERSMLPELDRLYEEKKYRNMSFILNGSRNDQGRYGYSHTYRYGYGYGYGYGYNYGTVDKKK